jgi:hypothetical protein
MFKLISSLNALTEVLQATEFKSLQNCSIDIFNGSVMVSFQIPVHTISSQKNNFLHR